MNQTENERLKGLVDLTADEVERYLNSAELEKVRKGLQEASKNLPQRYSLNLKLELTVFDDEREMELPLIQSGLTTSDGEEAYIFSSDSSQHRYLVNGEIQVVSHDYCPHCWGIWDFKFKNETCPYCEFSMGKEVKLLLDSNLCPFCEEGEIRIDQLVCPKCNYEIDKNKVAWG